LFVLKFNPPQNFASYRQAELDTTRINAFTSLEPLPYLSKRFLLQRFLGLTEEEIRENEKLWREESDEPAVETSGADLRGVGITPGALETDIAAADEFAGMEPMTPGAADAAAAPGSAPGAAPAGMPPAATPPAA
jgi:hypothetical protein